MMIFPSERGLAPLLVTLALFVSADGTGYNVETLRRDVQTCGELREVIAADAFSPAQPLVLALPHNVLNCGEGFEIALHQNVVIMGHYSGTPVNVHSEMDSLSFIVNHGHLRIERVHFRGPLVEGETPDPLVRGVRAIDNRDHLQLSMSSIASKEVILRLLQIVKKWTMVPDDCPNSGFGCFDYDYAQENRFPFHGFVATRGGAIVSSGPLLNIMDVTFTENVAGDEGRDGAGGAIFVSGEVPGRVAIWDTSFLMNYAYGGGDCLYVEDGVDLTIGRSKFETSTGDKAVRGGVYTRRGFFKGCSLSKDIGVDLGSEKAKVDVAQFEANFGGAMRQDGRPGVFSDCDFVAKERPTEDAAKFFAGYMDYLPMGDATFAVLPKVRRRLGEGSEADARMINLRELASDENSMVTPAPTYGYNETVNSTATPAPVYGYNETANSTATPAPVYGYNETANSTATPSPVYGYNETANSTATPAPVYGYNETANSTATPSPVYGYNETANSTATPAPVYGYNETVNSTATPSPVYGYNETANSTATPSPVYGYNETANSTATPAPVYGYNETANSTATPSPVYGYNETVNSTATPAPWSGSPDNSSSESTWSWGSGSSSAEANTTAVTYTDSPSPSSVGMPGEEQPMETPAPYPGAPSGTTRSPEPTASSASPKSSGGGYGMEYGEHGADDGTKSTSESDLTYYEEEEEEREEEYEDYREKYGVDGNDDELYYEDGDDYGDDYDGGDSGNEELTEHNMPEGEDGDPSVDDNSFVMKVASGMFVATVIIALGIFLMRRRRQTMLRGDFQGVPHRGLSEGDNL